MVAALIKERSKIKDALPQPTQRLKKLKGYSYVSELRLHPGKPIEVSRLYCLDQVDKIKNVGCESDLMFIPVLDVYISSPIESPIAMTDQRTINEIKEEIRRKEYKLQIARENNDYGVIDDCMNEIEALERYLFECVGPSDKIKTFNNETRRHASSILRAVQYYLRKLQEIDPAEANHIAQHVVIGHVCYWSVDPIQRSSLLTA